jgi:hypothetical protein
MQYESHIVIQIAFKLYYLVAQPYMSILRYCDSVTFQIRLFGGSAIFVDSESDQPDWMVCFVRKLVRRGYQSRSSYRYDPTPHKTRESVYDCWKMDVE